MSGGRRQVVPFRGGFQLRWGPTAGSKTVMARHAFMPTDKNMNILLRFVPVTILLACTGPAAAQGSDRRVADLVRTGKVRIGLFSTQFSKDTGSGDLAMAYTNPHNE